MLPKSRGRFAWTILSILGLPMLCACESRGGAPADPSDLGGPQTPDLADAGSTSDLKQPNSIAWFKQFSTPMNVDRVNYVAVDPAGNVFVACQFSGPTDFGDGPRTTRGNFDVAIVKYSAAGDFIWVRHFGGTDADQIGGLVVDGSGNVVIAGTFLDSIDFGGGPMMSHGREDYYLAKYSGEGRFLWAKVYGSTTVDSGWGSLAVDSRGFVYLGGPWGGGATGATMDLGGGPLLSAGYSDSFVLKLNADGDYLNAKSFGGPYFDYFMALTLDPNGDILLGGQLSGAVDLGGGPMTAGGGKDWPFVARLDNNLAYKWAVGYYDGGARVTQLAVDPNGEIAATGVYASNMQTRTASLSSPNASLHGFLLKLDASGAEKWARSIATGSEIDQPTALIADSSQLVVGSFYRGTADFGFGPRASMGYDMGLSYYSLSGTPLAVRHYGGPGSDFPRALARSSDAIYLGGSFEKQVDFDGTVRTVKGIEDAFILKLSSASPPIP